MTAAPQSAAPTAERRLTLDGSPGLATNCYFVGNGDRADVIWSHDDWETLCQRLHNGNAPNDFLLAYRDKNGSAKFAKAHKADAKKRAGWAYHSITGAAKIRTGIGFYPRDRFGRTCWAALDFDAHNPYERSLARERAMKAFALLFRNPNLLLILGTSGASGGWHLFVLSEETYPCSVWASLLREVSDKIGVPIQKGVLEIFPSDERGGCGIRAPGSWNPKDDSFGLIVADYATPRLKALSCPKRSNASFYARATFPRSCPIDETNEPGRDFYRGEFGGWQSQFAINAPRSRHDRLAKLVGTAFFQCGREIARRNAEAQHREADAVPATPLSGHFAEFDQLWAGMEHDWRAKLSAQEREKFEGLTSPNEQDAFRIIRNWQRKSEADDFPVHCQSLADRLGITPQGASRLRRRFCSLGILRQTAPYVPQRKAARYEWLLHPNLSPEQRKATSNNEELGP